MSRLVTVLGQLGGALDHEVRLVSRAHCLSSDFGSARGLWASHASTPWEYLREQFVSDLLHIESDRVGLRRRFHLGLDEVISSLQGIAESDPKDAAAYH